jgi:hypothetical protein
VFLESEIETAIGMAAEPGAAGEEAQDDVEAVISGVAPPEKPERELTGDEDPNKKGFRKAIVQTVNELWPDGPPPGLLKKTRDEKIRENMKNKGLSQPVERTIRRAIRGK